LVLGVGCERDVSPDELVALARQTLADAGLSPGAVTCVTSVDLKADEAAVHAVADALGVPARFFTPERLEQETPRLATPSDLVFREVGCHGVAEGAALAAVGDNGALAVAKRKSARATCAVARAPAPLDGETVGQAQGRLAVIGIGPGDAAWRTPEADRLISEANDLVGYALYLDLLGDVASGKQRHAYALGEEEARVRAALDLAADGRNVALICSGDAGIYAMATLVFELVDAENRTDWRRLRIDVAPGISALQAAAARIGAPLGHDFCAISLSDLLTPWTVIQNRIDAAARGDFVIAFYNPVSQRRTTQLAWAREKLLTYRSDDTPVILARKLGREGETVETVALRNLDPTQVDMLTLVIVGATETRSVRLGNGETRVYTPRGYDTQQKEPKDIAS
jgi:cobalt-precorrin 5A hydrolase/precorrin-3B C17-methyltransferase